MELEKMKPESIIASFDCLMICTTMGLALNKKSLKQLVKKHHIAAAGNRDDPGMNFYKLHLACHCDKYHALRTDLEGIFNRQSVLERKYLEANANDCNYVALCRKLMKESPSGALWAMLTSPNIYLQDEGIYHANNILLKALVKLKTSQKDSGSLKELHKEQQHNLQRKIAKLTQKLVLLNKKNVLLEQKQIQLEQENQRLKAALATEQKRPDENNKLKREIRKLNYELNQKSTIGATPLREKCCNIDNFAARSKPTDKREVQIVTIDEKVCDQNSCECPLDQLKVAVIGGIERLGQHYRNVVEQLGGEFFSHNGNCNGSRAHILETIICKSDIVIYITSINSHNALYVAKATCKKTGRTLNIMRSASPSALKNLLCQKSSPNILCKTK